MTAPVRPPRDLDKVKPRPPKPRKSGMTKREGRLGVALILPATLVVGLLVIKDGEIVDRDALPTVKVLDYDPELPWPF